jgi:hypothetical protein
MVVEVVVGVTVEVAVAVGGARVGVWVAVGSGVLVGGIGVAVDAVQVVDSPVAEGELDRTGEITEQADKASNIDNQRKGRSSSLIYHPAW